MLVVEYRTGHTNAKVRESYLPYEGMRLDAEAQLRATVAAFSFPKITNRLLPGW